MTYLREKTVCFTGHRPEKLPGYGETENASLNVIRSMLYYQIYQSAEEGYKYFISGLARGVDLWAAEYVLEVKNRFPDIKLICAKPFAAHGENFKNQDLWSLSNVIEKADELICVSESYSRDCYRLRNQYMVDRSSKLIAVVDDYKSGTGQTIKRNTPEYICVPLDIDPENKIESLKEIRVRISNQNQLDAVSEADRIIIPTNVFLNNRYENISKIIIEPPRFIYNEAEIFGVLKKCKSLGAEHLMCSNPAYIKIGKELGFKLHGDFGLNTANSYSLNFLKKMNFEDTVLSFEMKLKQISSLRKAISTGIIAYGYLPVMLTKNCPIKNEVGCEKCKKIIFDRTGRANKIVCHGNYTEILNAQALYLADRLEDLKNISFITLYFTDEGPDEIKKIIDEYRFGYSSKDNITRGLYYRGVI